MRFIECVVLSALVPMISGLGTAQTETFSTVPAFPMSSTSMHIRQAVKPNLPFTVTGSSGAILGLQNGSIELWDLPTKVFSNLRITAELDGYSVPINMNAAAAAIDVEPDHTTITYSHAAITVKQHMFVPAGVQKVSTGAIMFFEIDSIRPATLTISMDPSMAQQWPSPQYGRANVSWVKMGSGGGYVMATDNPSNVGFVAMPNAEPGVLFPYQERPESLPIQFKVRYEPVRDHSRYFPLLAEVAMAGDVSSASVNALKAHVLATAAALPEIYRSTNEYYAHFFDDRLTVKTPDAKLDAALRWAEVAIEQNKVKTGDETGLVAGWYPSFDSTRPGFGWYFGRDTLWTLYAVNSYGDRTLAQESLEFLSRRQRDDGKMMHEFPLTAESLEGPLKWSKSVYEYAAADATPLYIMAVHDYVKTTGDVGFLRAHWEQLKKAYAFDRAHDSDGDGVYDNSEGTGWVESWPPLMPHQEMYLASLDAISSDAMVQMAETMQDSALAANAKSSAEHIAVSLEQYRQRDGRYAFSRNRDGSYDQTATVFPAVAMWTSTRYLPQADVSLEEWAGMGISSDWGARAVAEGEHIYDPISYHQGSVWPLFTGWVAMAEYRGGRPMAGYASLMRNVNLTWQQDPGFVTEVISGKFLQPLGRSSSHQLWSSGLVFTPAVRGLFGIEGDALHHTLWVRPAMPASWEDATVRNIRVGDDLYNVSFTRMGAKMRAEVVSEKATVLCLNPSEDAVCAEKPVHEHRIELELPVVELSLADPGLPETGSVTMQSRVVSEVRDAKSLTMVVEGMAGAVVEFVLRRNVSGVRIEVEGGEVVEGKAVKVKLPAGGEGVVRQRVVIRWSAR